MKSLLLVFACLSFSAFAHDSSERMVNFLKGIDVPVYGKRERLEVDITCRRTRKVEKLCTIIVEGPGISAPAIYYRDVSGEQSEQLSNILIDFGIKPYGKKDYQEAWVKCVKPKHNLSAPAECTVIDDI